MHLKNSPSFQLPNFHGYSAKLSHIGSGFHLKYRFYIQNALVLKFFQGREGGISVFKYQEPSLKPKNKVKALYSIFRLLRATLLPFTSKAIRICLLFSVRPEAELALLTMEGASHINWAILTVAGIPAESDPNEMHGCVVQWKKHE